MLDLQGLLDPTGINFVELLQGWDALLAAGQVDGLYGLYQAALSARRFPAQRAWQGPSLHGGAEASREPERPPHFEALCRRWHGLTLHAYSAPQHAGLGAMPGLFQCAADSAPDPHG